MALAGRVALLAVLLSATSPGPASAHAGLVDSNPQSGEVLRAPLAQVRLVFDEAPLPGAVEVAVTDQGGRQVAVGAPAVRGNEVLVAVGGFRRTGTHVLGWRVVAGDEHPESGEIRFRVGRGALGTRATTATVDDALAASAFEGSQGEGVPTAWLGFGALLLALTITPRFLVRRRAALTEVTR